MSNLEDDSIKDILKLVADSLTKQANDLFPNMIKDIHIDENNKLVATAINKSKPLDGLVNRNPITNISRINKKGIVV